MQEAALAIAELPIFLSASGLGSSQPCIETNLMLNPSKAFNGLWHSGQQCLLLSIVSTIFHLVENQNSICTGGPTGSPTLQQPPDGNNNLRY